MLIQQSIRNTDQIIPGMLAPEGPWRHCFSHYPFDVELALAEGVYLYDTNGKRYIDASGGPMAVNIGHGDPRMKAALSEQFDRYAYVHPTFANRRRAELCEALVAIASPSLNAVYLCSGGSEAVDSAVKLARQYHVLTGAPGKYRMVSYFESYHGMTLATMSLAGNPAYRKTFDPVMSDWLHMAQYSEVNMPPDVSRDAWGVQCAQELERVLYFNNPGTVAAFIATPHGAGADYGLVPPASYWREIRRICDEHNILFIADEVVTGFGRTGRMFAMEHFDVEPDLMTLAKGISGANLPLAAILVSDKVNEPFRKDGAYFLHGFTFQGHPMACAAGLATLQILHDDKLVEHAAAMSPRLFEHAERLKAHPTVADVRGWGLFMAMELVESTERREYFDVDKGAERLFQAYALKNGLAFYGTLYGPRRSAAVRRGLPMMICPPLCIQRDQIDDMMDRLDTTLSEWEQRLLG
ncbi:aspartate aminotransferase family protein [Paraburkholderia sacchari]|uniref:aminotransferase family protein n=1 Tax=Paraburkholderia sacchari TaxID=159450 RepID=UPI001BCD76F0|nr:aminotransferase class III-fold pyridoxal phosphate-dependent enzyme [Paraburkholderia sacchari]